MLKKFLSLSIAILPFNRLRIFLYRLLLGYDITYNSRIGMFNFLCLGKCRIVAGRVGNFNYINANHFEMAPGSEVRRFNKFRFLNRVTIGRDSVIAVKNSFTGFGEMVPSLKRYENVTIGECTIITRRHSFDAVDSITIGDNVTFAGSDIQVWTHGFDEKHVRVQSPVT
ncbi:MAG: hypothetical protein NTV06_08140, partial [candidate division Zixibacteria bacterium]|nr:hypothetical protein [candidate division Zixibacteria bacterium]